jgi:hypothetical protein
MNECTLRSLMRGHQSDRGQTTLLALMDPLVLFVCVLLQKMTSYPLLYRP